jgi:hypothetical protein
MPKVTYNTSKGLVITAGSSLELGHASTLPNGNGTTIPNSAAALAIGAADTGKVFISNLASETKTITISGPVGTNFLLVQNVPFTATKNLVITCGGTDTFIQGSYARCARLAASGKVAGASSDTLTIANVNTNNSWGKGSTLKICKVADGKWLLEADGQLHGSGKADAFAFS